MPDLIRHPVTHILDTGFMNMKRRFCRQDGFALFGNDNLLQALKWLHFTLIFVRLDL